MMNVEPVVIEDDDIVMIDNDDDKNNGQKETAFTLTNTIVLDGEPLPNPIDGQKVPDRESSFARLLKNNTLMNRIVNQCLNMKNNAGMSRVVNKTLLPLYSDAHNSFKETKHFTKLLRTYLKKLKCDPNYKFLHVKSLCEELKAGKYRRKVPFVTLSREVKHNKHKRALQQLSEICKKKSSKQQCPTKKHKNISNETIINLDNSDDEPITLDGDDDDNDKNVIVNNDNSIKDKEDDSSKDVDSDSSDDIMIIEETVNSDIGCEQSNKENNELNENNKTPNTSEFFNLTNSTDISKGNKTSVYGNNNLVPRNNNIEITMSESEPLLPKHGAHEHNHQKNNNNTATSSNSKYSTNKACSESKSSESLMLKGNNTLSNIPHSDLLVPKKVVKLDQYSHDFRRAIAIEQQIALYQEKIVVLEKEEVTNNCNTSPYIEGDKYKAKIVQLYKKLCKITGNGDGNLLKQRVVRLKVAEGHPPGPVNRLERFLNNSIDETGIIPLPDLHDVVRCVTQSNIVDNLGWNKHEIMREALALFTHCGNALRKSRQRREYKDLLGLVRDKSLDDYDPANDDPHLLAKLEENKIIAKVNEEEILDRFVKMEYLPKTPLALTPRLGNMSEIKVTEYTDSESDTDLEVTPPKKSKTDQTTDNNDAQVTNNKITNETVNLNTELEETSSNLNVNTRCNQNIPNVSKIPNSIKKAQGNSVNFIQHALETLIKNAVSVVTDMENRPTIQTTINTIRLSTHDITKISMQHSELSTILNPTNTSANSTTQNLINVSNLTPINSIIKENLNNTAPNIINAITQNIISTTTVNTNDQNTVQTLHQPENNHLNNTRTLVLCPNSLQKIGSSNRYVVSYDASQEHLSSNIKPLEQKDDSNLTENNINTSANEKIEVKTEDTIKQEPIDINSLLNALGDNYISTIFDIEDPFLVVDISSDSSDDDL